MTAPKPDTRCFFAQGPPAGLAKEARDGWGVDLSTIWLRAHREYRRHDDGYGQCKVCGCAIDFDAWLEAKDKADLELERAALDT